MHISAFVSFLLSLVIVGPLSNKFLRRICVCMFVCMCMYDCVSLSFPLSTCRRSLINFSRALLLWCVRVSVFVCLCVYVNVLVFFTVAPLVFETRKNLCVRVCVRLCVCMCVTTMEWAISAKQSVVGANE